MKFLISPSHTTVDILQRRQQTVRKMWLSFAIQLALYILLNVFLELSYTMYVVCQMVCISVLLLVDATDVCNTTQTCG